MNVYELSKTVLIKLVVEQVPFATVLRQTFKKVDADPQTKSNVSALVGCELRHHYIFDNLINRFVGENVEFNKTIYLRFYLANHLFLKRFMENELLALAKADLDSAEIDKLINGFDKAVINELCLSDLEDKQPRKVLNQWTYHARMYNAARYVCENDDMNIIQLVSFGCGLDAITTDEMKEILESKNKIYTQIKIDEITNMGAVRIRLRSLFKALERIKKYGK